MFILIFSFINKFTSLFKFCSNDLLHKWEFDGNLDDSVNNNPLISYGGSL